MVKKLFALASVTALTGLVSAATAAGCSSTTEVTSSGTDAGDAGKKDGSTKPPVDPGDADTTATGPACMGTKAFDATQIPYQPPYVKLGSCTDDDLTAFVKYSTDNKDATIADEYKFLHDRHADCAACVYAVADDNATTWHPILTDKDPTATDAALDNIDVGGCIGIVSGKPDCGEAYQQYFWCPFYSKTCASCSEADFSDCRSVVYEKGNPCEDSVKNVLDKCGAQKVGDYEKACDGTKFVYEGAIRKQCISSSVQDAGPDADGG